MCSSWRTSSCWRDRIRFQPSAFRELGRLENQRFELRRKIEQRPGTTVDNTTTGDRGGVDVWYSWASKLISGMQISTFQPLDVGETVLLGSIVQLE